MPSRDPDYLKRYYQANKDKWAERRKKHREAINARKRELYRTNPKVRDYYIRHAKEYRAKNPEKRRHNELMKRYRLSAQQYKELLKQQKGRCAVCRLKMTKTPHVDHCHKTGVVRGLLCFNCNRAIGHCQDDPKILRAAADYLEKPC